MMALLGSLLGFGSSFLPEVLSYFKANQQQKHRMEMMQLETELAQKRSEMKLVELDSRRILRKRRGCMSMTDLSTLADLSTVFGVVFVLLLLMPFSDCS